MNTLDQPCGQRILLSSESVDKSVQKRRRGAALQIPWLQRSCGESCVIIELQFILQSVCAQEI